MENVGISLPIVRCFRAFYADLRQRFRFGQVDGSEWSVANGLAQGCPASPDLLNILFEPFHRWAAAQGCGVQVLDALLVASLSWADDLSLVARSLAEVTILVQGFVDWCNLLGISIHLAKTQVWCNRNRSAPVTVVLRDGPVSLPLRDTFKVVGIELGAIDRAASTAHFTPRFETALKAGRRLQLLLFRRLFRHIFGPPWYFPKRFTG